MKAGTPKNAKEKEQSEKNSSKHSFYSNSELRVDRKKGGPKSVRIVENKKDKDRIDVPKNQPLEDEVYIDGSLGDPSEMNNLGKLVSIAMIDKVEKEIQKH